MARKIDKEAIHRAVYDGSLEAVVALVEAGLNINNKDEAGRTPLRVAVDLGDLPVVQLLVRHGAKQHFRAVDGHAPIHEAVFRSMDAIVRALLADEKQLKTVRNLPCMTGWTPLHFAAAACDVPIMAMLLEAGADPNRCTHERVFALEFAERDNYKTGRGSEAAALLRRFGAKEWDR